MASSLKAALGRALRQSVDGVSEDLASIVNMDSIRPPGGRAKIFWTFTQADDLQRFATGSDKDIGGLSTCDLAFAPESKTGHFRGVVSSDIPRGAKLARSGYAAMRNKARSSLLGVHYWNAEQLPYLSLRVRNTLAGPPEPGYTPRPPGDVMREVEKVTMAGLGGLKGINETTNNAGAFSFQPHAASPTQPSDISLRMSAHIPSSDLRRALVAVAQSRPTGEAKTIWALGLGVREPPGPKFFVNIQTGGVGISGSHDLFQHRLWLDPRAGNAWQTVVIPFDAFAPFAQGAPQLSERRMARDEIMTVGLSVFVEPPNGVLARKPGAVGSRGLAALRRADAHAVPVQSERSPAPSPSHSETQDQNNAYAADDSLFRPDENTPAPRREGETYRFDLGIESVSATGSGSMDELMMLEMTD